MEALKNKGISLLRWSEKYTKTDMVYMFKNSFWVFIGQITTSLTALIVMVVLANVLSKETLGAYRFIISALTILSVFTLQGVHPALVQSVARGVRVDIDALLRQKILWSIMGLFATLLVAGYYFAQANIVLGAAFLTVAVVMPLYGAYFIYFFYLQGQQRFAAASIIHALGRIFFMIVMIITALIAPTLLPLTIVFLVSTVAAQYVGYRWFKKHEETLEYDQDPELMPYAKHMTVVTAFPFIAANIDKVLVWNILGAVPLAIYSIAILFPQESSRIGRIVSQVILPKLSKQAGSIDIASFIKKLILFEVIMIAGWLIYALIAPLLFSLFFPAYIDAVGASIIAMLILLSMPLYIIRQFFIANKNKKELNRVLIITPIIQTICLYFALISFGMWGAVVVFVLGGFLELAIGSVYLYWLSLKQR